MAVSKRDLRRIIAAICFQCRAGHTRTDCRCAMCPAYAVLPQAELDAVRWWQARKGDWLSAETNAYALHMAEINAKFPRKEFPEPKKCVVIKIKHRKRVVIKVKRRKKDSD